MTGGCNIVQTIRRNSCVFQFMSNSETFCVCTYHMQMCHWDSQKVLHYVSLESFPPSFDSKCRNPLKLILKTNAILHIKDTDPETLNPHFFYVSLGSIACYIDLIYFIWNTLCISVFYNGIILKKNYKPSKVSFGGRIINCTWIWLIISCIFPN